MNAPPWIHSNAGRPVPSSSPYTRTGIGPCGPSTVSSRVGTSAGGSCGGSMNSRTRRSFSGSAIASWREAMPSSSGNRDATSSWIGTAQTAVGSAYIDALEPVIQPTTWSRSAPAAGMSATFLPRLRITIRSATS